VIIYQPKFFIAHSHIRNFCKVCKVFIRKEIIHCLSFVLYWIKCSLSPHFSSLFGNFKGKGSFGAGSFLGTSVFLPQYGSNIGPFLFYNVKYYSVILIPDSFEKTCLITYFRKQMCLYFLLIRQISLFVDA